MLLAKETKEAKTFITIAKHEKGCTRQVYYYQYRIFKTRIGARIYKFLVPDDYQDLQTNMGSLCLISKKQKEFLVSVPIFKTTKLFAPVALLSKKKKKSISKFCVRKSKFEKAPHSVYRKVTSAVLHKSDSRRAKQWIFNC